MDMVKVTNGAYRLDAPKDGDHPGCVSLIAVSDDLLYDESTLKPTWLDPSEARAFADEIRELADRAEFVEAVT